MSFDLFIKPRAELDLLEAYYYYEGLSDGIGAALVHCVGEKMEFISNNPRACPIKCRDIRRALVPKFPYGIYYKIEETRIVIFGILDLRQDPHSIQFRLEKED